MLDLRIPWSHRPRGQFPEDREDLEFVYEAVIFIFPAKDRQRGKKISGRREAALQDVRVRV